LDLGRIVTHVISPVLSFKLSAEVAIASIIDDSVHILGLEVLISHVHILAELLKVDTKVIKHFSSECWRFETDL
jgi:hypothetical protein